MDKLIRKNNPLTAKEIERLTASQIEQLGNEDIFLFTFLCPCGVKYGSDEYQSNWCHACTLKAIRLRAIERRSRNGLK